MSTITLESIQNELIREILDIKNVKVLESVRKTLVHAKKEMESVSTMVAEDEEPYMTKSEIMDGLSEACKDIKLQVGAIIPLQNEDGNRFNAVVKNIQAI